MLSLCPWLRDRSRIHVGVTDPHVVDLLERLSISLRLIEEHVLRRTCTLGCKVAEENTSTLADSMGLDVALRCVVLQSDVRSSLCSMNLDADWFRAVTTLN